MAGATVFESNQQNVAAVVGENTAQGDGVFGVGHGVTGRGVVGTSEQQNGVTGVSTSGTGVWGTSQTHAGVFGESKDPGGNGVCGQNLASGRGVLGISTGGDAVFGAATADGRGVVGTSDTHTGVEANSDSGAGVWATSNSGEAIHAITNSGVFAAIAAFNNNLNGTGAAVYGKKAGSIGHAGFFDGDVHVTRTVTVEGDVMLQNADCAEEFTVADPKRASPGTVMVIDETGLTVPCTKPHDHRAVGVISGGGEFRPALVLDRQGGPSRRPIALMGKVFCKVDADLGAIRPGDLLTTSATEGHAMRLANAAEGRGAIIGKALAPLGAGRGMIPILVVLQ
jgi:hypothetical protein